MIFYEYKNNGKISLNIEVNAQKNCQKDYIQNRKHDQIPDFKFIELPNKNLIGNQIGHRCDESSKTPNINSNNYGFIITAETA